MRLSTLRAVAVVSIAYLASACVADMTSGDPDPMGSGDEDINLPIDTTHDFGKDPMPVVARKVLDHSYQVQETTYWCGPAATRVALSTRMTPPSQGALANQLPTTVNGTDWIGQVTRTLNARLGGDFYVTTEMPNDPPTKAQRDQLWDDLTRSIDNGYGIVTNIVAPPNNHPPGYPAETIYHYFAVVGYDSDTNEVYIADSANFSGNKHYWLSFSQLATLIPPKGYSALKPSAVP